MTFHTTDSLVQAPQNGSQGPLPDKVTQAEPGHSAAAIDSDTCCTRAENTHSKHLSENRFLNPPFPSEEGSPDYYADPSFDEAHTLEYYLNARDPTFTFNGSPGP